MSKSSFQIRRRLIDISMINVLRLNVFLNGFINYAMNSVISQYIQKQMKQWYPNDRIQKL